MKPNVTVVKFRVSQVTFYKWLNSGGSSVKWIKYGFLGDSWIQDFRSYYPQIIKTVSIWETEFSVEVGTILGKVFGTKKWNQARLGRTWTFDISFCVIFTAITKKLFQKGRPDNLLCIHPFLIVSWIFPIS